MPATFGTGVGSPHPEAIPAVLGSIKVTQSNTGSVPSDTVGRITVVTCIEVVSHNGITGGRVLFLLPDLFGHIFWAINIGDSVDTFEWRGLLPLGDPVGFAINNQSVMDIDVIVTGFKIPVPPV